MSADLRRLLAQSAARESQRFQSAHRDDDLLLYERAIGPRRSWRRVAEASGAAAIAASVAIGVYAADAVVTDRSQLAPATAVSPSPMPTAEASPRAADVWRVEGRPLDEDLVPAGPAEAVLDGVGISAEARTTCDGLDALVRFEFGDDPLAAPFPKAPMATGHVGGFHAAGAVGVYEAEFARRADASAYLEHIVEVAERCRTAVGSAASVAVQSDVALGAVVGRGVRVDIAREGEAPWRAWVHAHQGRAVAVIAEPLGADAAAAILVDYFTGLAR